MEAVSGTGWTSYASASILAIRAREAGWVQHRNYSQKWPPLCISEPPSDNFRIVGKQEVIRFLPDRPDSPANASSAKPASNSHKPTCGISKRSHAQVTRYTAR